MTGFPRSAAEAAGLTGELRAGGTDIGDRRRRGVSTGPVVDLRDVVDLRGIEPAGDGLRIGSMTRLATLAADPRVTATAPALQRAATLLATPQIREAATLGGSLLQRVRCAYYRDPSVRCHQSGGHACPARDGVHDRLSCFDLGPCLAPHPSTIGLALMVQDATVEVDGRSGRMEMPVSRLFGDGRDPTRSNVLRPGDILVAVRLAPAVPGERGAYARSCGRLLAEWPLADACVRLALGPDGRVALARVAIGGVAPIPLRRELVEQALIGQLPTPELVHEAASLAARGANPLPALRYKLPLVIGVVEVALGEALGWPAGGTA